MNDSELSEILGKARSALPGSDPVELAELVTRWALGTAEPERVLLPAVHDWVQAQERSRVRETEREVFTGGRKRGGPYVNPAQEAMTRLLRSTVYVPGEGLVRWGELTVARHEKRIAYLKSVLANYTAGMNDSVSRHEKAVAVLTESGYRTLGDYADAKGDLPVEPPDGKYRG
jgi:hypothetical protein